MQDLVPLNVNNNQRVCEKQVHTPDPRHQPFLLAGLQYPTWELNIKVANFIRVGRNEPAPGSYFTSHQHVERLIGNDSILNGNLQ